MQQISSVDNKHIKLAVKLGDRKHREREGLFLVEGKKIVVEVLRRPELVAAVFVDENLAPDFKEIIGSYDNLDWYSIDTRLMKRICATENPQGIAAIMKKPQWSEEQVIKQESLLLLLDHISDPGNMGTIIRTAWALGVDGVLLTRGCADPFSPKVVRSTMGGILNVPIFGDISPDKLKLIKKQGYQLMAADLNAPASFFNMKFSGPQVIVIGSEARGVSDDIKSMCDTHFKIPINPGVDSLNAAVACAIILEEAYRQRYTS